MKYYLAYGSNLNKKQMDKRCHDNQYIANTVLNNYRLIFRSHGKKNSKNAYLTIEKKDNSIVPLSIYKISNDDENQLDKFEGIKNQCYIKISDFPFILNGENLKGIIYLMNVKDKGILDVDYFNKVKQGYLDRNMKEYLSVLEVAKEEQSL